MSEANEHLRNGMIWAAASRITSSLFGMASVAIIIDLLGREAYGHYASLLFFSGMVQSFGMTFVMQSILSRFSNFENPEVFRRKAMWLVVAVMIFAAATGGIIFCIWPFPLFNSLAAMLVVLANILIEMTRGLHFGAMNPKKATYIDLAKAGTIFLGLVGMALLGVKADGWFKISLVQGASIIAVALVIVLFCRRTWAKPEYDAEEVRQMGRYGFAISIWMLLAFLVSYVDRMIIGKYLGVSVMGEYASTYDVTNSVVLSLSGIVVTAIHPIAMRGTNGISGLVVRLFFGVVVFGFFLAMGSGIVFWGAERLGRIQPMSLTPYMVASIAMGIALWQSGVVLHKCLEIKRQVWRLVIAASGAFSVNVLTNIGLIPVVGVWAGAIGTLISGATYVGLVWILILASDRKDKQCAAMPAS